jgi:hypothetical protein
VCYHVRALHDGSGPWAEGRLEGDEPRPGMGVPLESGRIPVSRAMLVRLEAGALWMVSNPRHTEGGCANGCTVPIVGNVA